MLDKTTIDALTQHGDLSAYALYDAEVARLPRFSRQEQRELVDGARQGNQEARHLLVMNCLHWVLIKAHSIYDERRPLHVDVLDLMEEANLQMLEKMDKALTANDPVAYLMAIAAQTIRVYCTYSAPMIQRPESCSLKRLAEMQPLPLLTESLDTPMEHDKKGLRYEHIAAPDLSLRDEEEQERRARSRFAQLYNALQQLSSAQRATTIRLYGLYGWPAETPREIAETAQITPQSVRGYAIHARNRLYRLLVEHLSQMC